MSETDEDLKATPDKDGAEKGNHKPASDYIRVLVRNPFVKKLAGKDILEAVQRLLAASGLISALFTRAYANPIPFGVVMIILGGYASALGLHRTKGRFTKHLIQPTLLVFIGICVLVYTAEIRSILIDYVSSFNIATFTWAPQHKVLAKTKKVTEIFRGSYPTSTVIVNGTTRKYLKTDGADLIADTLVRKNSLVFLVGPARSDKEYLAREWAYNLADRAGQGNRPPFSYVFYVEADRIPKVDLENPKWPHILSSVYPEVVGNEKYYETVLRYRPSLIVLSNLERVGRESGREQSLPIAESLVRSALDITENNAVSVLISTRPDDLLALHNYERDLFPLTTIRLKTLDKETSNEEATDLKLYLDSVRFKSVTRQSKSKIMQIEQKEVFRSLFSNTSFLYQIAMHVDRYAALTPMDLCDQLLADYSAFHDYVAPLNVQPSAGTLDLALQPVYDLALRGSEADRPYYGFYSDSSRILLLSGLVDIDIEHRDYVFSPAILQHYFAVKGLQQRLAQARPESITCSQTLSEDLALMEPLDENLRRQIHLSVIRGVIHRNKLSGKECR